MGAVDVRKFVEWYMKMDYEGGPAEMARWGPMECGSRELDAAMEQLWFALGRVDRTIMNIEELYDDEIKAVREELDEG